MQHNIELKAGVTTSVQLQGRYFVLYDAGAAGTLEVALFDATMELERITEAVRGLSLEGAYFNRIELKPASDCTIKIIVSDGRVRMSTGDGASVKAEIVNQPVNVVQDRGAPANPVYVSGLTYSDAPATALQNIAAVACGPALTSIVAADATAKALRIYNQGPDPVAIGAAGLTWANRSIVLNVGDTWVEDRGANLQWYGITDAGLSATVTAQRVQA